MTEMTKIEVDVAGFQASRPLAVGDGLKADRFFKAGYRAADTKTAAFVEEFAVRFLGRKAQTPKNKAKYLACMTDFLVMVRRSGQGLVSWQTGTEHYTGAVYSREIAEETRYALERAGLLKTVQDHTAGLCRVYKVDKAIAPDCLNFKKSNSTNVLKVREARVRGKKKGKLIPLKRYSKELVLPRIEEMEAINTMMEAHPLKAPDGTQWDGCYRLFNNGDPTGNSWVDQGGRIYGGWQSRPEEDRLQYTIDGDEVCEIDIKACFLFIELQLSPYQHRLPEDPYKAIKFVGEERDEGRQEKLRDLAKLLTSAILSKDGPVTRFPKGPKKKGSNSSDGEERRPLREVYGLGKKVKCKDLVAQIEEAFPFLKTSGRKGLELMYEESEVMVEAMLTLVNEGIPTYPVHDCLLCKKENEDRVVGVLQEVMKKRFSSYATLEVGYKDEPNKIISSSDNIGGDHVPPSSPNSVVTEEKRDEWENYEVIEDF